MQMPNLNTLPSIQAARPRMPSLRTAASAPERCCRPDETSHDDVIDGFVDLEYNIHRCVEPYLADPTTLLCADRPRFQSRIQSILHKQAAEPLKIPTVGKIAQQFIKDVPRQETILPALFASQTHNKLINLKPFISLSSNNPGSESQQNQANLLAPHFDALFAQLGVDKTEFCIPDLTFELSQAGIAALAYALNAVYPLESFQLEKTQVYAWPNLKTQRIEYMPVLTYQPNAAIASQDNAPKIPSDAHHFYLWGLFSIAPRQSEQEGKLVYVLNANFTDLVGRKHNRSEPVISRCKSAWRSSCSMLLSMLRKPTTPALYLSLPRLCVDFEQRAFSHATSACISDFSVITGPLALVRAHLLASMSCRILY